MAAWLTNDLTLPLSSSASIESVMLVSKVMATVGADRDPCITTPDGCGYVDGGDVTETGAVRARGAAAWWTPLVHATVTSTTTAAATQPYLIRLVDLALVAHGAVGVAGALGAPAFAEDLV